MNVDKFFSDLNENSWRQDKKFHAERKFESLLEYLSENKEEIIERIVSDVKDIEHIKTEDNEEFAYNTFEKWLDKLTRSNISEWLEDGL